MNKWTNIPLSQLAMNEGQIKGLPRNPRSWTRDQLERLKMSIIETPLLLQARGLIVYPIKENRYVVIGGNMRYMALLEMDESSAPCYVLPKETSPEKLKEIAIKDNGSFGEWDADALMEAWSDFDLDEFGVVRWNPENAVTQEPAQPEARPEIDPAALPQELQGIELTPEGMENLVGDDETVNERIIITFTDEERRKVEQLFGVRDVTARIVWRLEDLLKLREEQ